MRKFKAVYAKNYTKQDGSEGTSWKQLGFANEVVAQDGKVTIHLSLDSIPTGSWDGEVKLFLQDEQQNNNGNQNNGGHQQQNGYQNNGQQRQHTDYQSQGNQQQGNY